MGRIRDMLGLAVSFGMVDFALAVFRLSLRLILKKRDKRKRMQYPELNLRIEMFGNLVDELQYWHKCISGEEGEDSLEYCEERFQDAIDACKDMRLIILEELEEYVKNCRTNDIPLDLGYYRVKRQLTESTFD
jgi:hypothetical protein